MSVPWPKRLRRAIRSRLIVAALKVAMLLPHDQAFRVGGAGGALAYHLFGKTRRLALDHLRLAFPEKTEREREAIARQMFVNLGRSAMEVISIRSFEDRLGDYIEMPGVAILEAARARGKGVIFVTGHIGNWELAARRVGQIAGPVSAIAKRGLDQRLNDLIQEFRASANIATLWREDPSTARALLRVFKNGHVLGILVDQDTAVQGLWVPFFGRPAYTPRAPADLALRSGATILVGACYRRGSRPDDGFLFEITEVPYDPNPVDREAEVLRITATCQAIMEEGIRRNPADWVWMHERWKTKP
jgi:KDO2-lipid IV(A) lauroyltransferase